MTAAPVLRPAVAVCVATYRRPQGLAALLDSLGRLEVGGLDPTLIVADNEPTGPARGLVEDVADRLGFPVRYLIEPRRGIATVRNRLIAEATDAGVELVAFIDDDERADPQWLTRLVHQQRLSAADAVGGRQEFVLAPGTPDYVRRAFATTQRPTGQEIQFVSTANVVFRLAALQAVPGPFDERLNALGGSDGLISARLRHAGFRLVGCHEAVTYESVPPSRAGARNRLLRAYRTGGTRAHIAQWVDGSRRARIRCALVSGLYLASGTAQTVLCVFRDRRQWLEKTSLAASGLGGLAYLATDRAKWREYDRVHGA